jgi:hypothetical protein
MYDCKKNIFSTCMIMVILKQQLSKEERILLTGLWVVILGKL